MESEAAMDIERMLPKYLPPPPIDPKRARFPCCIVWTPLPVISWLIPFIGHIGICREDGVILDFAGPNFVCVDHFTFGAVARYIQINREQCCISHRLSPAGTLQSEENSVPDLEMTTWDDALRKSTQEFQHRSYDLFTCNCHSFVSNNLNRLLYGGHDKWNVVNLAVLILLKGTWVNKRAFFRSYLPFIVVLFLGLLLVGSKFAIGLVALSCALVGWFLIGTYCFKNVIQL